MLEFVVADCTDCSMRSVPPTVDTVAEQVPGGKAQNSKMPIVDTVAVVPNFRYSSAAVVVQRWMTIAEKVGTRSCFEPGRLRLGDGVDDLVDDLMGEFDDLGDFDDLIDNPAARKSPRAAPQQPRSDSLWAAASPGKQPSLAPPPPPELLDSIEEPSGSPYR